MRIHHKIMSSVLGGALVLGMAGAAMAAPAIATGSVNVRTGPSTQYQRVDTLQRHERVDVVGCRSGWCYVEHRGADGWVSGNYLQAIRGQRHSSKPAISFSFNFGNPPAVHSPRPRHDRDWDRNHRRDHDWRRDDRNDRHRDRDGRRYSDRSTSGSYTFQFGN